MADKVSRKLSKEEVQVLKDLFKDIDVNSDGSIDLDELDDLLRTALPADLPDQTRRDIVQVIIDCSDKNNDGKINLT
eukprot:gene12108-721_t